MHNSGPLTIGESTYNLNIGLFNPEAPASGNCSAAGGLETADGNTNADTLTFGTLVMQPSNVRGYINRNSAGATLTDLVIQDSATVIGSDVNARSLTVDNPVALEQGLLDLRSPNKATSRINLAGPAEFGGSSPCALVYRNMDNRVFSRAEMVGATPVGGFTLHDRAVIRKAKTKAGGGLHLEVNGHFDVQTEFRTLWEVNTSPPDLVVAHWDTRTTDLLMVMAAPIPLDSGKIEVYARDVGNIIYKDTPCRGALQDVTISGTGTEVTLVNQRANNVVGCSDTLYVRNIKVEDGATLEVGSQILYYHGALTVNGTVTQNGDPLSKSEYDTVFIKADYTRFGDLDGDGDFDSKDIYSFCQAYNQTASVCSVRADGNCDGVVGDADKALMEANMGAEFVCP